LDGSLAERVVVAARHVADDGRRDSEIAAVERGKETAY
jgi:hypothetical protein